MSGMFQFTLCFNAEGGLATKVIGKRNGAIFKVPYPEVAFWRFVLASANDHQDKADTLHMLSGFPSAMLIRGTPLPHVDLSKPHLRRWANGDPKTNTLGDEPKAWLVFDVDGYPVRAPLGLAENIRQAVEYIRSLLPEEFRNARCVFSVSPSTGLSGDDRLHCRLWFALDHPVSGKLLDRWAQGARALGIPVDPSVMRCGQPIYTARPIFRNMLDPVPPHLFAGVIDGTVVHVPIVLDRYEHKLVEIEHRVRDAVHAHGDDWKALLDATVTGTTGGCFEPLTAGIGAAVRAGAPFDDVSGLISGLLKERADPERQRHYDQKWVRDAYDKFTSFDRRQGERDRVAATEVERRFFNPDAPAGRF